MKQHHHQFCLWSAVGGVLRNDCHLCHFQMHKKVLDKGKPDDIMPGIKNKKVNFVILLNPFYKVLEFYFKKIPLPQKTYISML